LATRATAVQVDRLSPDRVGRWATHRAGRLGLAIAPEAVELLVAAVGNDLGELAQELEKLAALAHGRTATRDDVTAAVGVRQGAARCASWANGWTHAELARAIRRTLAADRALKGTGTSDERGIILQLVVECALRAREAA